MSILSVAKVLYLLARIRPLMVLAGTAVLLGIAVAVQAVGFGAVNWGLTALAAIFVLGLNYVAHPINDIFDYEVDKKANIEGTGRHKVLLSGISTKEQLTGISLVVIVVLALLALYLIYQRPMALVFAIAGFAALFAYNLPPLKLSYRPFSELFLCSIVGVSMVMGVSIVATGVIVPLSIPVGIVSAIMSISIHTTYFAMDTNSDYLGGKVSTLVKFPDFHWSAIYPFAGMVISAIFASLPQQNFLFAVPLVWFAVMACLGFAVDECRLAVMSSKGFGSTHEHIVAWGAAAIRIRGLLVNQMYVTYLNAIAMVAFIIVLMR